jgi:hypothetical protein
MGCAFMYLTLAASDRHGKKAKRHYSLHQSALTKRINRVKSRIHSTMVAVTKQTAGVQVHASLDGFVVEDL